MVFDSEEITEAYQDTWRELRAVDFEQGTRLAAVFHVAATRYPDLAEVVIQLADDDMLAETNEPPEAFCRAIANETVIVLPTNPSHYEDFIDGVYRPRLRLAKDHIRAVNGTLELQDVMNAVAAHELWHGHETQGLIQAYGYNRAVQLITEQQQAAMATLPLCMATSEALSMWRDEASGYRQRLHEEGQDSASFVRLVADNVIAYNNLPSEKAADNFAYDVMKDVYLA